jgi:hypothetical protein
MRQDIRSLQSQLEKIAAVLNGIPGAPERTEGPRVPPEGPAESQDVE